jgi:hypothetical protein
MDAHEPRFHYSHATAELRELEKFAFGSCGIEQTAAEARSMIRSMNRP